MFIHILSVRSTDDYLEEPDLYAFRTMPEAEEGMRLALLEIHQDYLEEDSEDLTLEELHKIHMDRYNNGDDPNADVWLTSVRVEDEVL